MPSVETLINRVLKNFSYSFNLEFNQYARFLVGSIKETEFFIGMTPKWRAYWIISELMTRYYGERNYPVLKRELKEILQIRSPVSNYFTKDNPRVTKFRKEFDEYFDALKLKTELRKSNYHEQAKLKK